MKYLNSFFKLASDETRLRIMILLAQQELCVCQLSGITDLSQPKISKHLSKLKDTGFVSSKRNGKFIYYTLKIDDALINEFINGIVNQIECYPQLNTDKDNLKTADSFLKKCTN